MKTSRIGVDIDGVLADFNAAYIDLCIEVAGVDRFPARPFDIPCWNYPEFYGYSSAEVKAVWARIKQDMNFWFNLQPYSETQEALGQLAVLDVAGNDIYFVTSRPGIYAKAQTEAWLHMQGFNRATVLISDQKGLCARGLKLDYYLDDRWENCCDVVGGQAHYPTAVSMLDRPWNRENNLDGTGITVVASAFEFARNLANSLLLYEPT